jgi:YHS domain-containing protein
MLALRGRFSNSIQFRKNDTMKNAILFSGACLTLVLALTNSQAEDKAKKITKVNCVVAGKEIEIAKAVSVSYRKATAYVCCNNCKAKFEKDSSKFATKANHQLFQTSQAKQAKCPLSGGDVDSTRTVKVSGVSVAFCCGKCQGKVNDAKGDDQLALVFSDKAFDKGFEVTKKKTKK